MAVVELADVLGISRSATWALVDELVTLGVVGRDVGGYDRRLRLVSLQAAAARLSTVGGSRS